VFWDVTPCRRVNNSQLPTFSRSVLLPASDSSSLVGTSRLWWWRQPAPPKRQKLFTCRQRVKLPHDLNLQYRCKNFESRNLRHKWVYNPTTKCNVALRSRIMSTWAHTCNWIPNVVILIQYTLTYTNTLLNMIMGRLYICIPYIDIYIRKFCVQYFCRT
jgi:hypothetical protein